MARVHLAWPPPRLALEYDGVHHDHASHIVLDLHRVDALQPCGWTVLVIDRLQLRGGRFVDMSRRPRTARRTPR